MRGQVPTPEHVTDQMVGDLFRRISPKPTDYLLDPGCGEGAFIEAVIRWAERKRIPLPRIVGVEQDPAAADVAKRKFRGRKAISIRTADFLTFDEGIRFRYVIGNPPYVAVTQLSPEEKSRYREEFLSAKGRFDLYFLFFEHALNLMEERGRLSFITPEKWLYVESAAQLRDFLSRYQIEKMDFYPENAFPGKLTYPVVTQVKKQRYQRDTDVNFRDGVNRKLDFAQLREQSWLGRLNGHAADAMGGPQLHEICLRIGVGIATGLESVFCLDDEDVPDDLREYSYPTIAGRDLDSAAPNDAMTPDTTQRMLCPYREDGTLRDERELGALGRYLRRPAIKKRLLKRTCTIKKPWYAYHDNAPLDEILRPKILFKDITRKPVFWPDWEGVIVPRHSVYYIVPDRPERLAELLEWLNGETARNWLLANCQRAANGYIRLQSKVIRKMPVPNTFR